MNEQNKIFEIREYLDDYGKISDHELLDVTRELEYMEKLYSQNDSSNSNTNINEDDDFIRELSTISEGNSTIINDSDNIIEALKSFELTETTKQDKIKKSKPLQWGKGFLANTNKDFKEKKLEDNSPTIINTITNSKVVSQSNHCIQQNETEVKHLKTITTNPAFTGNIFERLAPK